MVHHRPFIVVGAEGQKSARISGDRQSFRSIRRRSQAITGSTIVPGAMLPRRQETEPRLCPFSDKAVSG
jgi:hypothetical protein